jgi:hypothetical protein
MTRAQRIFHRRAWLALSLLFPLICALSLVLRAQHARVLSPLAAQRGVMP